MVREGTVVTVERKKAGEEDAEMLIENCKQRSNEMRWCAEGSCYE